jgi:hypothetical protein
MRHEKTFEAINKLKDVEIELHRLKNLLEITGGALDAKSEWVGLNSADWNDFNPLISSNVHLVADWVERKLKEKNK